MVANLEAIFGGMSYILHCFPDTSVDSQRRLDLNTGSYQPPAWMDTTKVGERDRHLQKATDRGIFTHSPTHPLTQMC